MATSVEIRDNLVEALRLDLVGPDNNHAFANELLPAPPSRWYLTGFLVPTDAPLDQRVDDTSDEEIDSADDAGALDDSAPPDRAAARRGVLPSSMGLSVLVPSAVRSLEATVSWGDYIWEAGDKTAEPDDHPTADQAKDTTDSGTNAASESGKAPSGYRRTPHTDKFKIDLPAPGKKRQQYSVPNSKGLILSIVSRAVGATSERIPAGTTSLSVFLVNGRKPDENHRYRAFAFQTGLQLRSETPFVPRPDLRGQIRSELGDEWDERVADLHYRDVFEYAVGHGLSAVAVREPSGECLTVGTTWLPTAEVQRVAPSAIQDVELKMETLGALADSASATRALAPLVQQYESWITAQESKLQNLSARRVETARDLIALARYAAKRIQAGIEALTDPQVLDAFKIANRAIAQAIRRRMAIDRRVDPASLPPPEWYTFQLAFILMTLTGIKDPAHSD
ncbi:MAG: helicase, partial [Nitrososphaerota archaeon]|nr:helicase [Nitrososphaerota archaeon]